MESTKICVYAVNFNSYLSNFLYLLCYISTRCNIFSCNLMFSMSIVKSLIAEALHYTQFCNDVFTGRKLLVTVLTAANATKFKDSFVEIVYT